MEECESCFDVYSVLCQRQSFRLRVPISNGCTYYAEGLDPLNVNDCNSKAEINSSVTRQKTQGGEMRWGEGERKRTQEWRKRAISSGSRIRRENFPEWKKTLCAESSFMNALQSIGFTRKLKVYYSSLEVAFLSLTSYIKLIPPLSESFQRQI